ncbi:MAG: tripartite tricarboxylate transporter TctB family protein [Thermodesulfobacteriota bacterium]
MMAKADFITGLALILLSLYVIIESWRMPRLEHLKIHPLSAPGIVPAFIGGVLLIFGLILTLRSIKKKGHHIKITVREIQQLLNRPGNKRLLLTAILSIGYAGFLIGNLSYVLATGLFIFVFITLFELRQEMTLRHRWRVFITAIFIAAISSVAITLVFERLFLVTLP